MIEIRSYEYTQLRRRMILGYLVIAVCVLWHLYLDAKWKEAQAGINAQQHAFDEAVRQNLTETQQIQKGMLSLWGVRK